MYQIEYWDGENWQLRELYLTNGERLRGSSATDAIKLLRDITVTDKRCHRIVED